MAGKEFSGTTNNTTKLVHEHESGISILWLFYMTSKRVFSFASSVYFTLRWVGLFDHNVEYPYLLSCRSCWSEWVYSVITPNILTSSHVQHVLPLSRLNIDDDLQYRSILPGYGGTIYWLPWYCGGKFRRCCRWLCVYRRWGRSYRLVLTLDRHGGLCTLS